MLGYIKKSISPTLKRLVLRRRLKVSPFYKKYKPDDTAMIDLFDRRGMIDHDMNFFYNRIPKAANSTIVSALAEIKSGQRMSKFDAKNFFVRPSSLTKDQTILFDSYFKFTFVRNPYARTLSAYLDKGNKAASKTSTFEEFCLYLERGGLYHNIHWAPQTSILCIPVVEFDFVGKVENLEQDMSYVANAIGHTLPSIIVNHNVRFNAQDKIAEFYTPLCYDIVSRLYENDFCKLGYEKELQ